MKKQLAFILCSVCSLMGYAQHGSMVFDGQDAPYEIRDQRRIGPGTTYTEYYFNDIGQLHYKMRALVVEIDNENEYTYQTPFMARYAENGKYHQAWDKVREHQLQESVGRKPIASVMGGGFTQDALNEKSVCMEVGGGLVSDGIMHYMPQSGAVHYYVDGNDRVAIGKLTCHPVIKAEKAGEYAVSGYNRLRSNYPNGITVFANGYGMQSKFQTADIQSAKELGTEVVIAVDNKAVISSGVYTGRVVKTLSGSFNKFEEGQLVLSALQGKAEEYLKSLSVGEKVTLDFQYKDAQGEPVALKSAVKAFSGYAVLNGVVQGSSAQGYPQDALGLSADGKKSYYIHLDNRLTGEDVSSAPIRIFNQFIGQLDGLYDAILMDGGPSAEMEINGTWVSQGVGRQIPAAMMLYSTAEYSAIQGLRVASADFRDYSVKLPIGGEYTPTYYCFNKWDGVIPQKDYQSGIELTCDKSLGSISADGKTFIAKAAGKGFLYCEYKEKKDQMYIEVVNAVGVRVEPKTISGEWGDAIDAKLFVMRPDNTEEPVDNSLVKWSTNNSNSVHSCADGKIILGAPGPAEIYAEYEGMRDTITVDVVTAISQIEMSAPVKVSVDGDVIKITAVDASVSSVSCVLYSADGRIVSRASVNGSVLRISRRGAGSPVLMHLVVDGKKYVYKLI